MKFTVELLLDTFAICRLAPETAIPDWAQGEFVSITRTQEELSIVCRQENVPDDVRAERERRCLRIVGKLDFSLVGVIATLTKALSDANISVFALSTYDTDYFLVRQLDLDWTIGLWSKQGTSCKATRRNPRLARSFPATGNFVAGCAFSTLR